MIGPSIAEAAVIATECSGLYPSRSMAGRSIDPTAATSAAAEPEIPENSTEVRMLTCPSPPFTCPIRALAKRTIAWVIPETFISAPARMKSGIAISGKLSSEEKKRCGSTRSGTVVVVTRITTAERPMAKAIGTPTIRKTEKRRKRMATVMRSLRRPRLRPRAIPAPCPRVAEAAPRNRARSRWGSACRLRRARCRGSAR